MSSRMTRIAQFCEDVVRVVFTESEKFGVSPSNIMHSIVDCFNDKVAVVEKAGRSNRNDMMDAMRHSFESCPGLFAAQRNCSSPEPTKVLYSGNRTIVFWNDGDKTIVKCAQGQVFDEYNGFVAALAKKLYGSTSKVKKVIKKTMEHQDLKKEGAQDGND